MHGSRTSKRISGGVVNMVQQTTPLLAARRSVAANPAERDTNNVGRVPVVGEHRNGKREGASTVSIVQRGQAHLTAIRARGDLVPETPRRH